jgi:nucleoside 2-deoxyribosyltransferase
MAYERMRGRTYVEALDGWHAKHVFDFDKRHLDRATAGVLVSPAGKSAHLELGYLLGKGKPGFIFFTEEPERWDIMTQFATGLHTNVDALIADLQEYARG